MPRFRHTIEALEPYVPGEQPPAGAAVIKLNTNENPFPPSPRAIDALRAVDPDALRRYPHPFADEFREAAGAVLGVDPTWILAGNGSDDLLTQLMRAVSRSRSRGRLSDADLRAVSHAGHDARGSDGRSGL